MQARTLKSPVKPCKKLCETKTYTLIRKRSHSLNKNAKIRPTRFLNPTIKLLEERLPGSRWRPEVRRHPQWLSSHLKGSRRPDLGASVYKESWFPRASLSADFRVLTWFYQGVKALRVAFLGWVVWAREGGDVGDFGLWSRGITGIGV